MDSHVYGPVHADGNSRLHLGDINYYESESRLKHIPGALYNAYGLEHQACHPETRKELLGVIERWAANPTAPSIFWLNGMAGTGKSTIAYTVCERLNQQKKSIQAKLGASFFFKRGEGDRASAALLFPTIVHQLSQKIPKFAMQVDEAIKNDPDICHKALGEQFDVLFAKPLEKLDNISSTQYIVVIDALDECQKDSDIRILLQLLTLLSQVSHHCIRRFLTRRPEQVVHIEFSRISLHARQDMILHEVPPLAIEHDIFTFLVDAFRKIREDYNFAPLSDTLPEDWPGDVVLEVLTKRAVPLFIIAATIWRFVQDKEFDPQDQLKLILDSRKTGEISHMGLTYLPILEKLTSSSHVNTRRQIYDEFKLIIGAIVTVAEPLSRLDLATLLNVSLATVAVRLRPLHSVLQIPPQATIPIRTFHLSFAEFLCSMR